MQLFCGGGGGICIKVADKFRRTFPASPLCSLLSRLISQPWDLAVIWLSCVILTEGPDRPENFPPVEILPKKHFSLSHQILLMSELWGGGSDSHQADRTETPQSGSPFTQICGQQKVRLRRFVRINYGGDFNKVTLLRFVRKGEGFGCHAGKPRDAESTFPFTLIADEHLSVFAARTDGPPHLASGFVKSN